MGREIKRVPFDFDWPMNEVWHGFKNPHYVAENCYKCDSTGYSPRAEFFNKQWYGYVKFIPEDMGSTPYKFLDDCVQDCAMWNLRDEIFSRDELDQEAARLCQFFNSRWHCHLCQDDVDALWEDERLQNSFDTKPTAKEVNDSYLQGFGHDSINCGTCIKARCERENVPYLCDKCEGYGVIWPSKEAKELYEQWEPIEPPKGEGYQVWETVSEGSPVSPVFKTSESLVKWLMRQGYSETAATNFIKSEWVPSMIMSGGKMYKDIESMEIKNEET